MYLQFQNSLLKIVRLGWKPAKLELMFNTIPPATRLSFTLLCRRRLCGCRRIYSHLHLNTSAKWTQSVFGSDIVVKIPPYFSDSLPCSPDNQCGSGGKCLVDPLFPKKAKCRCDNGYRNTRDGRCTGRLWKRTFKRSCSFCTFRLVFYFSSQHW